LFLGELLLAAVLSAVPLGVLGGYASEARAEEAALFKQHCMACHTVEKGGGRRQGPNLWGLFERPIGGLPGFAYSEGLKAEQRHWTPALLDRYLEDPKTLSQDSYMMYSQADPEIRRRIILFLETASR